jgi:hypothetical protein
LVLVVSGRGSSRPSRPVLQRPEAAARRSEWYTKKRFGAVQNWTTDDCCTSEPLLRFIFPFLDRVMLDIFHAMRRLAKATWDKSHPAYYEFLQKIRECIFVCYEQDLNEVSVGRRERADRQEISVLAARVLWLPSGDPPHAGGSGR